MIGQTISHYHILDQLGEGGMGVVYLAQDTRLGRQVALKIPTDRPDGQHYARFLREARSVSALSHPHIATLFDYGETAEGRPFIVMELVRGRELGELLRGGELTLARALEIVEDVAEALGEAHRRGIVHRDIKPSNVIVNERGQVKVLDFGLAKLIGDEHELAVDPEAKTLLDVKTRSDVLLGTPLYLSPEQANGTPVDARSDLFALGALLYECAAGRPAFAGRTPLEIAGQVLHVDPLPPSRHNPRVPPEVDRIVMKALAKRPADRYQSAAEFVADLRAARAAISSSDHARTRRLPLRSDTLRRSSFTTISESLRQPRVSIFAMLLGAVAVLGLLAGAWWLIRPRAHRPLPSAQRLDEVGANYLREGAYWQASKALEGAVQADDRFALAHAHLAEAWMELDYLDRAQSELLKVNALVPDSSVLERRDGLYLDAVRYTVMRDYGRALDAYRQLVSLAPEERRAQAYVDLGRAYEKLDDVKNAVDSYLKATNLDLGYAAAYLRVGTLYGRQRDLAAALAALNKAGEIYERLGLDEGLAEVCYRRGYLYRGFGKLKDARAQLERALELAKPDRNEAQRVNILLQLSAIAYAENNAAQAEAYAREANELALAKGMGNLLALSYVDLGNTYFARGEYGEAEKYLKQGLDFPRRYNARRHQAKALINLGSLYIQRGDTDEGATYVQQALSFYQTGGYEKEKAQALSMLGRANRQRGNYAEALQAFEQQLQFAEQKNDSEQMALAHAEMGRVLAQQEKYPDALRHFETCYQLYSSSGNELRAGYSLENRGQVLAALGRHGEARALLAQAKLIAEKNSEKNRGLLANVYLDEAQIAVNEWRFADARTKGDAVIELIGAQDRKLGLAAQLIKAQAEALSGGSRTISTDIVSEAQRLNDPGLLSVAMLIYAEVALGTGDARSALDSALDAQHRFAGAEQRASEWRAWLVVARASRQLGDVSAARDYAARAEQTFNQLQSQWGAEAFNSYQARRDVQFYRRQIAELTAALH